MLTETVERLLAGLDADERPIVELSLQGHSTREISEQLDTPERTVRRVREHVRRRAAARHRRPDWHSFSRVTPIDRGVSDFRAQGILAYERRSS